MRYFVPKKWSGVALYFGMYFLLMMVFGQGSLGSRIMSFVGGACLAACVLLVARFKPCPHCGTLYSVWYYNRRGMSHCPHCGGELPEIL